MPKPFFDFASAPADPTLNLKLKTRNHPSLLGLEGFENFRKLKATNRFRVGARLYLTIKPKRSISHQRQL